MTNATCGERGNIDEKMKSREQRASVRRNPYVIRNVVNMWPADHAEREMIETAS